jgi:hypothetical protein
VQHWCDWHFSKIILVSYIVDVSWNNFALAYNDLNQVFDSQFHTAPLIRKIDVSRSHLSNGPSPFTIYDSQTIGT